MVDFGNLLKRLRAQEGMTQQQLADKLGVTKSVVSYYELQERYPSPEILIKLASIFHVSTDYLLGVSHNEVIELDGLSEDDIVIIKSMVAHLKDKNIETFVQLSEKIIANSKKRHLFRRFFCFLVKSIDKIRKWW